MRCFDKLSMTMGMGWDEMLRQAQHDSGDGLGWDASTGSA